MKKFIKRSIATFLVASAVAVSYLPISAIETAYTVTSRSKTTARAAIITAIEKLDTDLQMYEYNVTVDEVNAIFDELLKNPEFYYVGGRSYSYFPSSGKVTTLRISYTADSSELAAANGKINEIISEMPSDIKSDIDKALWVFEYMCTNFEYDTDFEYYRANELLANGRGVCNAYSQLYGIILQRLGMSVGYATSSAMNHIWNTVMIDGKWYHVDTTWADPIPDRFAHASKAYFLRSDAEMKKLGYHDWISDHTCDTEYCGDLLDNFENSGGWLDGRWYFADRKGKIYEIDTKNRTKRTVFEVDDLWYVDAFSYYINKYVGVCEYGDKLYYNGPDGIYLLDVKSGRSDRVLTYTDRLVFALLSRDGFIEYLVGDEPYSSDCEIRKFAPINYGDANGDGKINSSDVILLKKYIANYDGKTGTSSVNLPGCGDANGDGKTTSADIILLKKYIANYDPATGKSSITLGAG